MKKNIALLLVVSAVAVSNVSCKDVFIDVQELFKNTKEGKTILAQNDSDKESLFKLEYSESQKINEFREGVEKGMRDRTISENDLPEKQLEMSTLQKNAKRSVEDEKESVEMKTQQRMFKYRNTIFAKAKEVMEKQNWDSVKDSSAPGVICVASNADRTPVVMKALNEDYDKKCATSLLTKKK
jgi:hypothetical protein